MSAETDRAGAVEAGVEILQFAPLGFDRQIEALLDAGWVPPAQHNEELARIASWQRDARRAFAAVEKIADGLVSAGLPLTSRRVREALGEQFSTPRATS